jgi:hypothetical protein
MPSLFDYPTPDYGYDEPPRWGNVYLRDASGAVFNVRGTRATALRSVRLPWAAAGADLAQLVADLDALKGGQVQCYFYTANLWRWWTDAPAGTGNGSELNFPFGGTDLQNALVAPVVKVAGAVQSAYFTVEVIPADSLKRWRVKFEGGHAPASGLVTCSFMGRRLLLGGLVADPTESGPDYLYLTVGALLEGEEV